VNVNVNTLIALARRTTARIIHRGNDIYFPDKSSHCIRHLDLATRRVTTIAGQGGLTDNSKGSGQGLGIGKGHRSQGWSDGVGAAAKFYYPQDVAYINNQVIVADFWGNNLRRIDLAMYPYKVTSIGYTPTTALPTRPMVCSDGPSCASGIADGEYSPLALLGWTGAPALWRSTAICTSVATPASRSSTLPRAR
jgi:hypothetical protein